MTATGSTARGAVPRTPGSDGTVPDSTDSTDGAVTDGSDAHASGAPDPAAVEEAAPATSGRSALPRGLQVLIGAAALVVVAGGIRTANDLLAPIVLALVLTIAVAPLRRVALRHGAPHWAATLLVMVAAYAIVLFLAVSVAASLVQLADTLPQYAGQVDELKGGLQDTLGRAGLATAPTSQAVGTLDLGKLTGLLADMFSALLGVLSNFLFLVAILFFMTADAGTVRLRADLLKGNRHGLVDALDGFAGATQSYLIVSAIFGGIVAVIDTAALWLLGVPLALLWGLLAFVTNFIPNIGFFLGLIPPALLALLDGGWQTMLAVIVVYCVVNLVLQTFIQPRFVGDAVRLNITVTFLSLAVWTFLLGPLGALLAVPMTLLVRALLVDSDESAAWVNLLIGSTPSTPDARPA
jgi:AI-2 transport protein TqsA